MIVTVNLLGQLRHMAGKDSERCEADSDWRLQDLVDDLCREHGEEFAGFLRDDTGRIRPFILVLVNGEAVDRDPSRKLADGDEITLMPPISGG
jgi:MoaD family protein